MKSAATTTATATTTAAATAASKIKLFLAAMHSCTCCFGVIFVSPSNRLVFVYFLAHYHFTILESLELECFLGLVPVVWRGVWMPDFMHEKLGVAANIPMRKPDIFLVCLDLEPFQVKTLDCAEPYFIWIA